MSKNSSRAPHQLKWLVAAGLAGAALSVSTSVSAQTAIGTDVLAPDDVTKEFMRQGFVALRRGELEAARLAFLGAWAHHPHFIVALSLAEVETPLGRFVEAAEHWQYLLLNLPASLGDKREAAREQLEICRSHIGSLTLKVAPDGSTVFIDDKRVAATPLNRELYLEPGAHVVFAAKDGRRSQERTFQASAGSRFSFELTVPPDPFAQRPPAAAQPSPPAATAKHDPAPAPTPETQSFRTPLLIGGGVLAVVSAGAGTYFLLKSGSARDETSAAIEAAVAQSDPSIPQNAVCSGSGRPNACEIAREKLDEADHWRNGAIGAFITTGVAATATAVAFVLWPEEPATSGPTSASGVFISPAVGGNMNGALLWGRF